jgi:hypothetical protein
MPNFYVIEADTEPAAIRRAVERAVAGDIIQVETVQQRQLVGSCLKLSNKSLFGVRVILKSGKPPFEERVD